MSVCACTVYGRCVYGGLCGRCIVGECAGVLVCVGVSVCLYVRVLCSVYADAYMEVCGRVCIVGECVGVCVGVGVCMWVCGCEFRFIDK